MNKKPFYKCWWFWLIIGLAFLLCGGNILIAHLKTTGSNIFTAVSGWVSGIATAILGVIAVIQNKKYKEENDRYLKEQEELSQKNINDQNDLAWRNSQYQLFCFYVNTLNGIKNSLHENYFTLIHKDLVALPATEQSFNGFIFKRNFLRNKLKELRDFLRQSQYFLADKDKLYDKTINHLEKVNAYFSLIISRKFIEVSRAFKTNDNPSLKKEVMIQVDAAYSTWAYFSKELINHINSLYELIAEINYEDSKAIKDKIDNSKASYLNWKNKLIEKAKGENNG